MKILAMILLATSLGVKAESLRSLKDVMSDLGSSFKVVTLGLQAGTITSKMVAESVNISKYIVESESMVPDTILSLPNVEQPAATEKYIQELKELEKSANDLNAALVDSKIDLAKQILLQMGNLKKQGHKDYK